MKKENKLNNIIRIIALGLLLCSLTGCFKKKAFTQNKAVNIACTVGMITDITEIIGGDLVEVKGLMGPGVDPHLFRASEGDVRTLKEAHIIFYGGLHLEAKLIEIFEHLSKTKTVIPVTKDIPISKLIPIPETENMYDPHVWFDVSLWIYAVNTVTDTLIQALPGNKEALTKRRSDYVKKLQVLHAKVKQDIAQIPAQQRLLVTAHDAFHYFGKAYGVQVRGLQGVSTQSEAGVSDIRQTIDLIVDRKIPAIFVESSVPKRTIESVQNGAKEKDWTVLIGGELFSDAMGNPGTQEGTYIGMVEYNVSTIVNALLHKQGDTHEN